MAPRGRLILAIILIALTVVAIAIWRERSRADSAEQRADQVERQLGLESARVLTQTFERASALKVAQLSGNAVARSTGKSGPFPNAQSTRAPYTVNYFADLSGLTAASYRWNEADRIMIVELPTITVERPNIDMTRAQVEQNGFWISRRSGVAMQQQAATRLTGAVAKSSNSPENLARARAFAREAITALVAAPLAAAGLTDVRVVVRLAGEPKPPGVTDEQWDLTRPLRDVLADPKYR